jgi:hypothetical protein
MRLRHSTIQGTPERCRRKQCSSNSGFAWRLFTSQMPLHGISNLLPCTAAAITEDDNATLQID